MRRARIGALGAIACLVCASPAWAADAVYVANDTANSISAYSVGTDGGLNPISGSPFGTGTSSGPWGLAISPDGSHLFAARSGSNLDVAVFSIGADAGLTQTSQSPAGNYPLGIALTPDGSHLYATNYTDGTVSAYSVGAGGVLTPVTGSPFPAGTQPITVAVSADGRYVYVGNYSNGTSGSVSAYAVAASGALTQLAGSPFATDKGPEALIVTADGRHLYSANAASTTVSAFSIGADGSLSPVSGSPFPAGNQPIALAVTPDGSHLYAANISSHNVSAYSIGSDGGLSQLAASPFASGTSPEWAAVTPDGKHLYVSSDANVFAYSIGSDGGLSQVSGSPFPAGAGAEGLAITPDQGPVAAFSAAPATTGSATSFNGTASHDPDGTVARYDWNYGDGTVGVNAGPAPAHIYALPGTYTVTLKVTNDAGCSDRIVFTGQTASCNGGPAALASHTVVVVAPAVSRLTVTPSTFALTGRKVKGRCVALTRKNRNDKSCRRAIRLAVHYTLTGDATVRFTLMRVLPGRRVKGRCVKPTGKNGKRPTCKRFIAVPGTLTVSGRIGADGLTFGGKLGGRTLGAGTYRLTATPSVGGRAGASRTVTFRLVA